MKLSHHNRSGHKFVPFEMVALKEETILDKWRKECSSYGENFDTYQKIEALQGLKTTCKSSEMDLNHDELQSTTEKMLFLLPFQLKQHCEINRKKWVLESGIPEWIPGSTTYWLYDNF